ncbi:MAG: DMT family transporter [Rhodospirillaceae bacterium]|jgi:drug/metabolite transporter (DMT)-like permease|nr:DMT family transporter [Rhodospirillaceae bacterium]MBT7615315.1 DMT family transporter [Rhodospirillaceae bacterium]MBT7648618.1 DMT family transporter [Rhodospirillaceae bacterium]
MTGTSTSTWSDNRRAIGWMMASSVIFVGMELMGKQLVAIDEMSPFQLLWFRAVITALLIPLLMRKSPRAMAHTAHPGKQASRSFLIALASICFFTSLQTVPLADAVAIVFVSPLFLTLIAFFFLKESVGWHRWSACTVGFAGVLLIVQPGMGVRHWMYLLPLVDALVSAIYVVLTRRIGRGDSVWTSLFYNVAASAILFALPMPWLWVSPTPDQWWLLFGTTAFGLGAHYCHIKAYSQGESSLLAPLSYIHIAFTTVAAFLVFGTFPDLWAGAGMVLIVCAGLYVLHRETVRRGRPRPVAAPAP